MEEKPYAGVKEIARRANVSIATVDRVIHNRTGVSGETKAKIIAIIEELNYQPNVLAQRLALASRGTIRLAILLPAISAETEFWQAPLDGINQAEIEIKQYGVHIQRYFFDQNDPLSFTEQAKRIQKYKADGILLSPTFIPEAIELVKDCEKKNIPYVLINSDLPDFDRQCYIGPDLFQSGYLAAQLLRYCLKGTEKVVLVNIAREIDSNLAILLKEQGFRAYFKNNPSPNPIVRLNTTRTSYASVSKQLDLLLKEERSIGAIFVTNSRVSLVAKWLEKNGLSEVILLGYDFLKDNVTYLQKGVIDFLICEKPQEQGYRGIMSLFQNLVYSAPMEKDYLMPIDIITKENYRFYRN